MLEIKIYTATQDVLAMLPSAGLVICPGPKDADNFRSFYQSSADNSELQIITMANFVAQTLREIKTDEKINKKNKFALMMTLGSSFHRLFPSSSFNEFEYYFNLFTELRGITLDLELFANAVSGTREEDFKIIATFWQILESLNIVDEQKSYSLLSELIINQQISFFGFNNFSGTQIDFLKNLSHANEVNVFVSAGVKGNLLLKSWPQWLSDNILFDIETPSQSTINCSLFLYPKGSLNIALKELPVKYKSILIAQKNLDSLKCLEVAQDDIFYRLPIDLFKNSVEKLFKEDFLNLNIDPKKDIRDYKVSKLIEEVQAIWHEEIGDLDIKDEFLKELFKQMVVLNLPRNYMSSGINDSLKGRIYSLESIDYIDTVDDLLVVLDGQYNFPKLQKSFLPAEWEKPLRSLAPINNGEVEYYSTIYKLKNLSQRKNVVFLVENDVFHDHPFCQELFKERNLLSVTPVNIGIEKKLNELILPITDKSDLKFSASALQSYIECPRKYFFRYIFKIPDLLSDENSFAADEIGTLAHAGLAKLFKTQDNILFETKKIIQEHIVKWSKKINQNHLEKYTIEITSYIESGFTILNNIKTTYPNALFKFEEKVGDGRADLIIENDGEVSVLDFKLSASSIPNETKLLEFLKIQLLYYANFFKEKQKVLNIGYICLKDLDESHFFGHLPLTTEVKHSVIDLNELLTRFAPFKNELVEKIKHDTNFLATPIDENECLYCQINMICSRGRK